ncbi:GntR family transcriptional regulator [Streptomyces sp. NPDC026672]|uniref:GntR family transcriptional regulator n=1 Tax=unclassified Streptomyces TaxID=2593676 RepID=UPI00340E405B
MTKKEPAYRTLARTLRSELLQQRYADGVRLPTEAELAARYGVSRQTVRHAFQELVSERLVHRVPGRGTFAAPREDTRYLRQSGSIEDLLALSLDTTLEILRPLRRRIDVEAAGRLRLDGDAVHTLVFRRLHDGRPFVHTVVHLSPAAGAAVAEVPELRREGPAGDTTIIGLLDTRLPAPVAEAEQSITASVADASLARALDCDPGIPLLRIDRLYLTTGGRPVELSISHFLPEQYSYRVRLRRGVR